MNGLELKWMAQGGSTGRSEWIKMDGHIPDWNFRWTRCLQLSCKDRPSSSIAAYCKSRSLTSHWTIHFRIDSSIMARQNWSVLFGRPSVIYSLSKILFSKNASFTRFKFSWICTSMISLESAQAGEPILLNESWSTIR